MSLSVYWERYIYFDKITTFTNVRTEDESYLLEYCLVRTVAPLWLFYIGVQRHV